jgi:integrase
MDSVKLTKRTVDGLEAKASAYMVYDADLKGFAIRVAPTGLKTWQVEYRPYPGGRGVSKRRMSLGSSTSVTPDEARRKAKDILTAVANKEDPAKDRSDRRKELQVSDLIDLYESEGCYILRGKRIGEPMKPDTKAYTVARLRHHALPLLGKLRISEVSSRDIEKMVRDITAGKTARDEKVAPRKRIIVRGGEGAARKVTRDVSAMFTFAMRRKLTTINPCESAAVRKTDGRRTRYLSLDEVSRLGRALEQLQEEGANPKALDIVRLWALTGARRDEIAALRWDEVDLVHSCLRLKDTKTGESIRPIAAPAAALLASLSPEKGSPYVFPATSGKGHFQGTKRVWPKAIAIAQLQGVTPHTLRHTLGSSAVSIGETLVMTGAILGHRESRSTQIYAHVQQDPAARAATRAVEPIAAALAGKQKATVVAIKKAHG